VAVPELSDSLALVLLDRVALLDSTEDGVLAVFSLLGEDVASEFELVSVLVVLMSLEEVEPACDSLVDVESTEELVVDVEVDVVVE
jgi:hypothetical protein